MNSAPRVLCLLLASSLKFASAPAADAPPEDPAALGIFGIGSCHTNNRSVRDAERWVPQMQSIGLHYFRSGPTGWGQVEPSEGKWDWKALDEHMDYLTGKGFVFGGLLNGNVGWNKLDKPNSLPVNNLPAWSRYVTEIVRHTNGRIRRWEIWNEPPNGTARDQTAADYAKIVVAAHDAAKAADPTAQIGLAAKSVHVNYLEQAIKAGAKDHFDYITVHPYEVLNGIADNAGTEAVFMNIVPTLRKMLAAQDPERANVPIVFTELGCDVKKGADTQAYALIKAYTMGIAQGVACIQWFEGMDGDSGPMGLLDSKGNARPSYHALQRMIQQLGQKPEYLGWVLLNGRHYGFVFQGTEGPVLITWAFRGAADEVDLGAEVRVTDPLSGDTSATRKLRLTTGPVFVAGVPQTLLEQARANRGKAFSWGGDFSNVPAVSLTYGDQQVEKGLHTLSSEALSKAVVAYGGSARAGSVPGGNLFIVDPAFLSYTSTPIEITAVVRRNEANDNAGFKLVYESTTGFKTAGGWYTVPNNKEWHTVTWKIDDPQFVSYWGYNFSLESDGNQYNRYYLQSVTVKKRAQ